MPVSTFLVFPGTEAQVDQPDPVGPLDVAAAFVQHGNGPRTVTNPDPTGRGTLVAVCVAPSPGLQPSGSFNPPAGGPVQRYDYPGLNFVQRIRVWTLANTGQASLTFGFTGANTQTCALIALDGEATSVVATGEIVSGSTSVGYPTITTTPEMLVLAMATQQEADDLLSGPSNALAEHINNTASTNNRGLAVHKLRADSATLSPSPATWSGSVGAHVQFCLGFAGAGTGGGAPIPAGQWTVYVDPDDPSSWDENRDDGQLIVAGNRLQVGSDTDDINAGTGYGLAFDANSEIHSFAMEGGGETLRLGPRTVTGLQNQSNALILNHQWRNADGYNEAQEVNGVNLSTAFPGTDRTYFDGTRTQLSLIPTSASDPKAIRGSFGGETGDRVIDLSIFRIEQWMLAGDDNVAGGGVHASGSAPSPWSQFVGQGLLRIVTRDQTTPWSVGNNNPVGNTRASVQITLADVGDWWAVIRDYTVDPIDGHLHAYLAKGAAGFNQIVNVNGGYGLSYANSDVNQALWYGLLLNYYSWHRYTPGPTFNWDDQYGNVRTIAYACTGILVNPTGLDVADVQSHANYFLQASTGTSGMTPNSPTWRWSITDQNNPPAVTVTASTTAQSPVWRWQIEVDGAWVDSPGANGLATLSLDTEVRDSNGDLVTDLQQTVTLRIRVSDDGGAVWSGSEEMTLIYNLSS